MKKQSFNIMCKNYEITPAEGYIFKISSVNAPAACNGYYTFTARRLYNQWVISEAITGFRLLAINKLSERLEAFRYIMQNPAPLNSAILEAIHEKRTANNPAELPGAVYQLLTVHTCTRATA